MLFSAFFSGMEIAFVSVDKLRFEMERKGGITSRILSIFFKNPNEFISTMLVGNNIALVIYGILMAQIIGENLLAGFIDNHFLMVLAQTVISTLIILVTGEFLPKTLFKINPNMVLNVFAVPLFICYVVLYPISKLSSGLSCIFLRIFGMKVNKDASDKAFGKVDLDYFVQSSIDNAENEEELDTEVKIFQNALDFSNIKIRDCIVPRTEVVAVDLTTSLDELKSRFIESGISKIIVYDGNIDNVVGYIHSSEMFRAPTNWHENVKQVPIVPETMSANKLMKLFMQQKKTIAVVVDEFGGTSGIVSLEDLVEEIFGDIEDEHDNTSYISKKYETQLLQGTIARELSMGVWKEVEEEPEEGEEAPEEPVMVYKVVPNGVTLDLGAAQSIEDQPVHKYEILTLDNGAKVGYLMYNSFTAGTNNDPEKYNNELRKVSTIFQEANVQATILDLRYNEGGSLDCVQLLATILVPNARMGTPMAYLEYNDKNLNKDATINFDQEVLKTGVNLNQNTLVAITSGTTAGAAEMLLTSLYKEDQAPNIIVMGSASKGQTVATEQFINETYRWSVNPVVCTVYNSDHDAGEDAFVLVPSDKFKISETSINGTTDYSQFLPFGNPKERMLSIAIQTLEGTYPPKDEDKEEETRSTKSIKIEKSVSSPASRRFAGGLRIK